MNITDLEQLPKIKNEIKQIEERIEFYRNQEDQFVSDTVKCQNEYGAERIMVITGEDDTKYNKIFGLKIRLVERKKRLERKIAETENYIDTVNDSEIRQIIGLRYIDGKPWKLVARLVYGYPCEDRTRMRVTRFFAEN